MSILSTRDLARLTCVQEVNQWLKFYTVSAPLTVLSVFVSRDPGLDLRVEHSHGWGEDGAQGGL